jgi:undecaprenyl-diphosphatase
VTFGVFYPFLLVPLLLGALAIAASRILLGMHFLSDVLAGALLGTVLALTSHAVFA